ncbi:MAG: shikimate kinase [Bacillota bacterium]|nr:shikimate kinase [Bacillota bacterium]
MTAPDFADNIILIGMPGSGKSSLGRRLARQIGFGFIDSDTVLAAREGQTVAQLLAACSTGDFIERESAAVRSIRVRRSIIATGGSVVYCPRAMAHLARLGTIVYLDVPLGILRQRVGDLAERGVVSRTGGGLGEIFAERTPLYRRWADFTWRVPRVGRREAAERLAALLSEHLPQLISAETSQSGAKSGTIGHERPATPGQGRRRRRRRPSRETGGGHGSETDH